MASVNEVQDEGRKQSLQEGEGSPPNPSNCDILGHLGHYRARWALRFIMSELLKRESGMRWEKPPVGLKCSPAGRVERVCAVVCGVHDIKAVCMILKNKN